MRSGSMQSIQKITSTELSSQKQDQFEEIVGVESSQKWGRYVIPLHQLLEPAERESNSTSVLNVERIGQDSGS